MSSAAASTCGSLGRQWCSLLITSLHDQYIPTEYLLHKNHHCNKTFYHLCTFTTRSEHDHGYCTNSDQLSYRFAPYPVSKGLQFSFEVFPFALEAAYRLGRFYHHLKPHHFLPNSRNSLCTDTTSHSAFLHQQTSQITAARHKLCIKHRLHIESQYYEIWKALKEPGNAMSD